MASIYIDSSLDKIDKLSQNSEFFPLLCSLYHLETHGDVKEFFKNPFYVYQNELDSLSRHGDEGKYKICCLALLVLFNNQLKDKWVRDKETREQRHLIKATCDAVGINRGTSKAKLMEALHTLKGTFLHKEDDIYRTLHDKLFDFLAHYFGKKIIECLIEYCDCDLVHERFIWQTSPDDKNSNIDFIIEIPDYYLKSYLLRCIKDWSAGKVIVVFSNTSMKVSSFRHQFIRLLKQLDKSQQITLVNTMDTEMPKQNHDLGSTPLIENSRHGYADMVEWMLHNDVNVDLCRKDGVTGLYMASQAGHTDIVKLLLEKDPNVDLCNNDGCSPLLIASRNGNTDIVRLLLEKYPNVDLCDNSGASPLLMASYNGHTDIVRFLLEKDPNVDLCNNDGCSPLLIASRNGNTDIVRLLLEKYPNVDLCDISGASPLLMASYNGHTDIVRFLLEKDPNVDLCDSDGCSPLLMASYNGHTDIVKFLLEKDPNVDLCDSDGCSPLLMASYNGHTDIVKLLLEKDPNVDLCNNDGCSPLFIACKEGHENIVRLLLDRGADTKICRFDGESPLMIATVNGHSSIVLMVTEHMTEKENICS